MFNFKNLCFKLLRLIIILGIHSPGRVITIRSKSRVTEHMVGTNLKISPFSHEYRRAKAGFIHFFYMVLRKEERGFVEAGRDMNWKIFSIWIGACLQV